MSRPRSRGAGSSDCAGYVDRRPLRVGEIRVFYDVREETVEVLTIVSKDQAGWWLTHEGEPRRRVALAEVKDDLSRYLRLAEREEVVITRHGKPAGVLIGFGSENAWLEYRLENHPEFLDRVVQARADVRAGKGIRLDEIADETA